MQQDRKHTIATSFGQKAEQYNAHTPVQAKVAEKLASLIETTQTNSILEIGCGTGLHTQQLLNNFPDSHFTITDISKEMIARCRHNLPCSNRHLFRQCDGEKASQDEIVKNRTYDIITTSMAMQWFTDPLTTLKSWLPLLAENGHIYYATLGPDNFPEWQETLADLKLSTGTLPSNKFPSIIAEETIKIEYGSAHSFLKELKAIGASTPKVGYKPISANNLRKALNKFDRDHNGTISWHIIYGKLSADSLKNIPAR